MQGGCDYAHSSGFYAGTWLSNISWFTDQNAGVKNAPVSLASPGSVGAPYSIGASNAASLEWDFYAGYKNTFAGDWNYDVGLIHYYYPGRFDNLGAYRQPNTTEVYGAIGYKWLTHKYSRAISSYTSSSWSVHSTHTGTASASTFARSFSGSAFGVTTSTGTPSS